MKALPRPVMAFLVASASAVSSVAADPVASETIAPPDCKRPPVLTKIRKADDDTDFQEAAAAYKTCMNAYVETQSQLASKHTDAANAAIGAFNEFAKEVNEKKGSP